MPKENNKMQVDFDTLKKQNVNDLLSIKELYKRIEELGEKTSQIKYIDNTLVKKIKKEYEKLKKIILDENVQLKITNDIETINSHLDTKANKDDIETINSQLDNIITYPILEKEYGSVVGWEYASNNTNDAPHVNYVKNIQYPYGDVRRYGAVGDGVTDDTLAIQRAFECSNKIVFEKNKTYIMKSGIWIGEDVEVDGNNSKIIFTIDNVNQFFYKATYETNNKGLFSGWLIKTNFYDYNDNTFYFDNFIINNLNIELNLNIPYNTNDYRVFELCGYRNIIFKNTNIIVGKNYVYDIENDILNTTYVKNNIQPIVIRTGSNNVLIDNTRIENYTKGNWGSTLWFHSHTETGHKNITISNSVFYSQAGDEILSFMGNRDIKANIYNCKIQRKNNGVFNAVGNDYRSVDFMLVAGPISESDAIGKIELNFNNCEFKTINSDSKYNVGNLFGSVGCNNYSININLENCVSDLFLNKTLINSESSVSKPFCTNKIDFMMNNYININNSIIKFKGDNFLSGIGGTNCINHRITNSTIITNWQLYHLEYPTNNCITSFSCELKNNTIFIEKVQGAVNIIHAIAPQYLNNFIISNNVFYTTDVNKKPVTYNLINEKDNTTTSNYTMNHTTNAHYLVINNNNYINNVLVN